MVGFICFSLQVRKINGVNHIAWNCGKCLEEVAASILAHGFLLLAGRVWAKTTLNIFLTFLDV